MFYSKLGGCLYDLRIVEILPWNFPVDFIEDSSPIFCLHKILRNPLHKMGIFSGILVN